MVGTPGPDLVPADSEFGRAERCPHCRTVTTVELVGPGRFRCSVCGGPRVVVDDPRVQRSSREVPALKSAHRERFRVAAWRLGAALASGFGGLSLLIAALSAWLAAPGVLGSVLLASLAAAPLLFGALAWRTARRHARRRDAAWDTATCLAAQDVLEQRGDELDARELQRILHLRGTQAERFLARLQSDEAVRTRITDAGELAYSSSGAALRLRIDDPGDVEADNGAEPRVTPPPRHET